MKFQFCFSLLVRKDNNQLLTLSSQGHPAYTPVKLNIKTAVSFKNNYWYFIMIEFH